MSFIVSCCTAEKYPPNIRLERATIAFGQGARNNENFEGNATKGKPDSSSCVGITRSQFSNLARSYLVGNYQYLLLNKEVISEERVSFLSQCTHKVLLDLGIYQSFWQRCDHEDLMDRCYDILNVLKEYPCFSCLSGEEEVDSKIVDFLTQGVFKIRRKPMGKIDLFFFQQFLDDTMKDGGFNLEHIKYTSLFNVSQDIHSESAVLGSLLDGSLESSNVSRSAFPDSFEGDDFSRSASLDSFGGDDFSRPASPNSFEDDYFSRSASRSSFDSYSEPNRLLSKLNF